MDFDKINIQDYDYNLPAERIAQYPLTQRDQSKLLLYRDKRIKTFSFSEMDALVPEKSILVFNDTKVIPARILFTKDTGTTIEIFCLEPAFSGEVEQALQATQRATWKCFVGNAKRWKDQELRKQFWYEGKEGLLKARKIESNQDSFVVEFEWSPENLSFSEVIEALGKTPLPPYIKRNAEDADKQRYQTIYAQHQGSVAAPTAGLHFSYQVFEKLKNKEILFCPVTLHVGAGTFKPVTTSIQDHIMHEEFISISKTTIEIIANTNQHKIISVGTTTLRTLESIYWFGVKLIEANRDVEFAIEQWDPYKERDVEISVQDSLERVLEYMKTNKIEQLTGQTRLLIVPGYQIRIPHMLLTNFHMPKSTLLLLIAAFIGDSWKEVYEYALQHNFRFLSYGDSCLLFR